MRIIKFRAWDKHFKEMASIICLNIGQFSEDHILKSKSHPYTYNQKFENVILMQFTGLHDKNGREIYEGDILVPRDMHDCNIDSWTHKEPTEKDPYSCIGIPMQVKWIEHMCGFDVPPNTQYWEVIGNIHENPELLSGKEALKEGGGR